MDTPYSTLAIKYVGSATALEALDALRALQAEGSVDLRDAAVVARSASGELTCYPVRTVATSRLAVGGALGGLLLGLFFGKQPKWALFSAAMGAMSGWFFTLLERQRLASAAPYVEKSESALYLRLRSADWPTFQVRMRPYLAQGLPVIQDIAPAHTALRDLFAGATELQTPPRDEFPEPPTTGSLVPEEAEDDQRDTTVASAQREQAVKGISEELSPTRTRLEDSESTAYEDFTRIKGIGPVYQARLNDAGVYTFDQLAALTVEALSELAGAPASRVHRDDWIGQAAARTGTD